jgi:hypothetical protein
LVTVKTYDNLPEAEVGRSILEQNGIPAHLPDRNVAVAAWHLTRAVGGIRLQVPESELEVARELLGERNETLEDGGVDVCPECGSGDVFRPASLLVGVLVTSLTGIPLLMRRRSRYCRQCRHKWLSASS